MQSKKSFFFCIYNLKINLMHILIGSALIYLAVDLFELNPLVRTIFAFPVVYIAPGLLLISLVKKRRLSCTPQLMVESFFVSTVLNALLTAVFGWLGFQVAMSYRIFVVLLIPTALFLSFKTNKSPFRSIKTDYILVFIVFLMCAVLTITFSNIPRLFSPDETTYIFEARGILNGSYPITQNLLVVEQKAFLQGRPFWPFLLASFIGSACVQPYEAYLIGPIFLSMTALASTLFVPRTMKNYGEIRLCILLLILTSAPLLLFAGIGTAIDCIVGFYVITALLFFTRSFTCSKGKVSILKTRLLMVFPLVILVAVIKLNLTVFIMMWIWLVFVQFRYKLYKIDTGYKVLFWLSIGLPIAYELFLDIPYVLTTLVWDVPIIRDFCQQFLPFSPVQYIWQIFIGTPWQPGSFFVHEWKYYLNYLYMMLTPEGIGLPISAIAFILPVTLLIKPIKENIRLQSTVFITILSMIFYYLLFVSSYDIATASRAFLLMFPLLITIAVISFHYLFSNLATNIFFLLSILMGILLWINHLIAPAFLLYSIPKIWSYDQIAFIFVLFLTLVIFTRVRRNLSIKIILFRKTVNVKFLTIGKKAFYVLIILLICSNLYFSNHYFSRSYRFTDNNRIHISEVVESFADNNLFVASNYIYLRPYVSDEILFTRLLPLPATENDFYDFIKRTPNNTILVIDENPQNGYLLPDYIQTINDIPIFNAINEPINTTGLVGWWRFNKGTGEICIDSSGNDNNGLRINFEDGWVNDNNRTGLSFDGVDDYIEVNTSPSLDITDEITIEMWIHIDEMEAKKGYMILSKGYAVSGGSYDVFIWDKQLYWSAGGITGDPCSVSVTPYLGAWHYFVMTYSNGSAKMFIEGTLVKDARNEGIATTDYNVNIGRDSQRNSYNFNGIIDDIRIYNRALNSAEIRSNLGEIFYRLPGPDWPDAYALLVYRENLPSGRFSIYKILNSMVGNEKNNVTVNELYLSTQGNDAILNGNIDSSKPTNITIFVRMGAEFLNIYNTTLQVGNNNVTYRFGGYGSTDQYKLQPIGLFLKEPIVFIIDGDGNTVFDQVVSRSNIETFRIVFIAILLMVLCIYLFLLKFKS